MRINLIEDSYLVTYDAKYNSEKMSIFLQGVAERYSKIDNEKRNDNKTITLPEIYYELENMLNYDTLNSEVLLSYLEGKPRNRLDMRRILHLVSRFLGKTDSNIALYDQNIKRQSKCLKEFYSLLEFNRISYVPLESFQPVVVSVPFISESDYTSMLMQYGVFMAEAIHNTELINHLKEPEMVLTKMSHK